MHVEESTRHFLTFNFEVFNLFNNTDNILESKCLQDFIIKYLKTLRVVHVQTGRESLIKMMYHDKHNHVLITESHPVEITSNWFTCSVIFMAYIGSAKEDAYPTFFLVA